MILTLLGLMFYIFMIKTLIQFIGWGIKIWFFILIGLFVLASNIVYYMIPIIVIVMLIGLFERRSY
ncbi:MAG: hypothetical protein Q4B60_03910 [Erysipelotrichaceae bacterium]|nr:hypothetical protein [Erysipelotrichaceae bacterium]